MKENISMKYKSGKRYVIILIIIIYLSFCSNKKLEQLRKLDQKTKISIIVNGTGNQNILNGQDFSYHNFNDNPSEIFINGKLQNYTGNIAYNLNDSENNITMIWDHLLTNCDIMFFSLTNIIKMEFINFDTSKVTSMYGMFFNCISITSLNLNNFDTSMVQNMDAMFYGCISLESLEINNFNTSSVNSMRSLFYNCLALTTLDLSNFDTSLVTEMYSMFYKCQSLKYLNLSNFNTSLVSNMMDFFTNCYSLTTLELYNLDTTSVTTMERMFYNCNSLKSLKINFTTPKVTNLECMFYNCSSLISLDLYNFISSSASIKDIFINITDNLIFCINEDKNQNIISYLNSYYPNYYNNCSDICFNKEIKIKINENNTCSFDCINDGVYKFEYKNLCYESCPNGTHNSTNNNFKCEEDIIIEINICNNSCNAVNFLNNICKIDNSDINCKDDIINKIRKAILNGLFDSLIEEEIINKNKDLYTEKDNIIYQLTSTYNQNKNEYISISKADLGKCENKLKNHYHIEDEDPLIMFKIEYYQEGLLIPVIEYEVYDIKEKKILNLTICQNETIQISIPVNIDEKHLFKYNISSDYYNDICFPFTTEYKTDIILSDRRNEYINNNMSLCESNCEFTRYNFNKKEAICECNIKIKLPLISEIVINKSKLLNNFINLRKTTNIYTIKCLKLLFSKSGIIKNIGSYILLLIILLNIVLLIYFKSKEFDKFCNKIKKLIKIIKGNNKNNNDDIKEVKKTKNIFQNEKISKYKRKNKIKKMKLSDSKKEDKEKKDLNLLIKENNNKNKALKKSIKSNDSSSNFSINNLKINKIKKINKSKILINKPLILKYNDYELNNLEYQKALEIDKRKYLQYYISLLKRRQIIIFTFYTNDDYNSKIIKISLFLFSFSIYFTINTLFFNDSTMHNIYEAKGEYNFIYQIPIILYSTIISVIINYLIKLLSLSEKNIIKIKNNEEKEKINEVFLKIKNILIIKFTFFYIFNFVFLIFFWFYISSFCAVYQNTQIYLIKDTIISFSLSLLYPFGICLIPGILRIPSLNAYKKDKECIYILSKILQLI